MMEELMRRPRWPYLALTVAIATAALISYRTIETSTDDDGDGDVAETLRPSGRPRLDETRRVTRARLPTRPAMPSGPQTEEPPAAATSSTVLVKASWGSGPGQIGRSQPAEANPEVAASFSATSDGDLVVLDKVNGRIVRYSRDGRLKGSIAAPLTEPQELLVGSDGSMLVMDRLVDERVAVLDPNGKELGQIPITGDGLKYGGSATGLFEDEDGIYVENEHSQVIRIGDREGNPDPERPTLDGRARLEPQTNSKIQVTRSR